MRDCPGDCASQSHSPKLGGLHPPGLSSWLGGAPRVGEGHTLKYKILFQVGGDGRYQPCFSTCPHLPSDYRVSGKPSQSGHTGHRETGSSAQCLRANSPKASSLAFREGKASPARSQGVEGGMAGLQCHEAPGRTQGGTGEGRGQAASGSPESEGLGLQEQEGPQIPAHQEGRSSPTHP